MTMQIAPTNQHPLAAHMNSDKDVNSRLAQFISWQEGRSEWWQPDLAAYRDDLIADGLSAASVSAYLGTVRGVYKKLLISNAVRDLLYRLTDPTLPPSDRKAQVEEMLTRLQNSIHPTAAPVKRTKIQDEADSKHLRLTVDEAERLLNAPNVTVLGGLRDAAVLAVLFCTGIRVDELCNLNVDDLRQITGGELALMVRHGKGDKQRLVPYGELSWCLLLVDAWMGRAKINDGPVFRGMARGNAVLPDRLTTRSVLRILENYPIIIGGQTVEVKPHDCRRTYARLMYEAGMPVLAISQNLGHKDTKTTLHYIGTLDMSARRARSILHYDVARLK